VSRPPQTWDTLLRMPVLLWLCQGQHPPGYRETIAPAGWRRLTLDAEVGRYMPGVRR
jgi:hypothetical protein